MQQSERTEDTRGQVPTGDRIVRVERRRQKTRLRVVPNVPGVFRFLHDVARETPLIPIILVLVVLWLGFSAGVYVAEKPHNPQFYSYGYTLWWSFTAMQTQGANSPGPITQLGVLIGSIWSIVGTVIFFGAIISTVYSYYMIPWRRQHSQPIVEAIQYNFNEMEYLSAEELGNLKTTVNNVIDARIDFLNKTKKDRG